VSVSGALFSVGVCVSDLLIFLHRVFPGGRRCGAPWPDGRCGEARGVRSGESNIRYVYIRTASSPCRESDNVHIQGYCFHVFTFVAAPPSIVVKCGGLVLRVVVCGGVLV